MTHHRKESFHSFEFQGCVGLCVCVVCFNVCWWKHSNPCSPACIMDEILWCSRSTGFSIWAKEKMEKENETLTLSLMNISSSSPDDADGLLTKVKATNQELDSRVEHIVHLVVVSSRPQKSRAAAVVWSTFAQVLY